MTQAKRTSRFAAAAVRPISWKSRYYSNEFKNRLDRIVQFQRNSQDNIAIASIFTYWFVLNSV